MNTYLVHPNDTQLKSMDLHLYDNEHNKLNSFNDLNDLIESSESDNLIYLVVACWLLNFNRIFKMLSCPF